MRNSSHLVVFILHCMLTYTVCFRLHSKKHITLIRMSVDEDINKLEMEILTRITSWNPFDKWSLQGLREKLSILTEREKRNRSEEERNRSEEERKKSEETKVITIFSSEIYDQLPESISRKIFEGYYLHSGKVLTVIDDDLPTKYRKIGSFDELVEQEVYYLEYLNSGFNFVEYSNVQTRDCVQSILTGQVTIFPFTTEKNSTVHYEYKITPPRPSDFKDLPFKFPIMLDCLIVSGDHWLLLESKHSCDEKYIKKFESKVQFISEHIGEKWVTKHLGTPRKILSAVCSVEQYSKSSLESNVIKIVRGELGYKLV